MYAKGMVIEFTYDSLRSGDHRRRSVVVEEMRETGKGTRVIAWPLDSQSGRDGVRTFIPERMTDVTVTGHRDPDDMPTL